MKNKMKLGVYGALLVSSLVVGALGTEGLVAEASSGNINTKVAQQVVGQFKDVTKSHYAYDAINWAKGEGIITGYPDGTFKPNEPITESQFAKMLAEFLGLKDDKGDLVKATPASHWADGYYDSLASYNTPLNAYFDNGLRNKTVKRGVVAQAISHLTGNANSLTDSINFMIGEGITTGQNLQFEGKDLFKYFGSNNNLTRAQVAAFLYRMHNVNIEQATGIAIVANKNEEGLTLVGQANKGMSKLDSSLRLGKLGSEKPSTGGGNNNGGNTKPPVDNGSDFSDAKLPVSSGASSKDVNVTELNKSVSKLSDKTMNSIKNNGYEVSMAESGRIVFSEDNLIISFVNANGRANISYSKNVDSDLVVSIIKDVTGYTVDKSKIHPPYENVINSKLIIEGSSSGNYTVYYTK
ncbi:S-layer homology domain-containing protein [Lysinibacillus sp. NPDC093712]|uniref:S-layer homology domain-containing protein n=1 Tax=Lysinibacillus sp. NPDC093712 TaxID=3390579 RepID=UPI003D084946